MKSYIVLSVLFLVSISNTIFSQNTICRKTTPVLSADKAGKKTATTTPKRKPLPKLTKVDSLLNEREFRIEEDEATKDLDLELSKMAYAPKVVVQKNKDALTFYYFKNMSDQEIEKIKYRLENDFKIDSFDINPNTMNCKVDFKEDASEEHKYAFFREFGYEGIIYH